MHVCVSVRESISMYACAYVCVCEFNSILPGIKKKIKPPPLAAVGSDVSRSSNRTRGTTNSTFTAH